MVTPLLRELTGPFPPWLLHERNVRHLTDGWGHVCRLAIQNGSAEDLHAARDDYQAVLAAHLKILDGCLSVLSRFQGEGTHAEFTERVTGARDDLQQHYDALFPRWQTLDDLEAILLERVSLPNDQLKALAAKYSPAPAWYDGADPAPTPQE